MDPLGGAKEIVDQCHKVYIVGSYPDDERDVVDEVVLELSVSYGRIDSQWIIVKEVQLLLKTREAKEALTIDKVGLLCTCMAEGGFNWMERMDKL